MFIQLHAAGGMAGGGGGQCRESESETYAIYQHSFGCKASTNSILQCAGAGMLSAHGYSSGEKIKAFAACLKLLGV